MTTDLITRFEQAGEDEQQAAQCLRNNEHLKDSGHD